VSWCSKIATFELSCCCDTQRDGRLANGQLQARFEVRKAIAQAKA
jgi:hypothetical protein